MNTCHGINIAIPRNFIYLLELLCYTEGERLRSLYNRIIIGLAPAQSVFKLVWIITKILCAIFFILFYI